jgi:hypothetical protein
MDKPGRNDPCPCGSGKKYKKCCMNKDNENKYNFKELGFDGYPAGFGKYIRLLSVLSALREEIVDTGRDGLALRKEVINYIDFFNPGKRGGLPVSYFTCWSTLDLWFGKMMSTVFERFIMPYNIKNLDAEMMPAIEGVKNSYPGFFEVEKNGEEINLKDVYNGNKYRNCMLPEAWKTRIESGSVWFTRVFGDKEPYIAMEPVILKGGAHAGKVRAAVDRDYLEFIKRNRLEKCSASYAEMNRDYFLGRLIEFEKADRDKNPETGMAAKKMPLLVNTDKEKVFLIKVYFKIIESIGLLEKLDGLRSVEKDKKNNNWIWIKKKPLMPGTHNTILGNFKLEGDKLVCEVNSFERAERLLNKFDMELSRHVIYEKNEVEFMEDALLERRLEQEGGSSRLPKEEPPELKDIRIKMMHDYYMKKWVRAKIPALGGISPAQASKTEEGRKKLAELIDYMDDTSKDAQEKVFDFNLLREKFNLGRK